MSICNKKFNSFDKALVFVLKLFNSTREEYIFRGHSKESFRLQSTMDRYGYLKESSFIEENIKNFMMRLARIGRLPEVKHTRRNWLELARHYGVPSPCIDFSYSPFIAIYFAINRAFKIAYNSGEKYFVIYALNIKKLAEAIAQRENIRTGKKEFDDNLYRRFLLGKPEIFKNDFPDNTLLFLPYPSSINKRMLIQNGAMLYDTIRYPYNHTKDLEEYIENISELPTTGEPDTLPTLYKIMINKSQIANAFQILESTNILGGYLFMNEEGIVDDVINARSYLPKSEYLWDIDFVKEL